MPRDAVSRTANVGTVGKNGLRMFSNDRETRLGQHSDTGKGQVEGEGGAHHAPPPQSKKKRDSLCV